MAIFQTIVIASVCLVLCGCANVPSGEGQYLPAGMIWEIEDKGDISYWDHLGQSMPWVRSDRMQRGSLYSGKLYATRLIDGSFLLMGHADSRFNRETLQMEFCDHEGTVLRTAYITYPKGYWPMGIVRCVLPSGDSHLAVFMVNEDSDSHPKPVVSESGIRLEDWRWNINNDMDHDMIVVVQFHGSPEFPDDWLKQQEDVNFDVAEAGFVVNADGYIMDPNDPARFFYPFR